MAKFNIYNADCLNVLSQLPDACIDLILCDPPYGTTKCAWDTVIDFSSMWKEILRVIKPAGAIVMFASQPFTSALIMSNPKYFKYTWVWNKNKGSGHLNAKIMPMKYHEDIVVFGVGKINYYPQDTDGHSPMNYAVNKQNNINGKHESTVTDDKRTTRKPRSVLDFKVVNNDGTSDDGRFHPSQKPLSLLEYLIKTYSKKDDVVCDFTMGSGSTGVACARTGRLFLGIELDADYFKIAGDRINKAYLNKDTSDG